MGECYSLKRRSLTGKMWLHLTDEEIKELSARKDSESKGDYQKEALTSSHRVLRRTADRCRTGTAKSFCA